MATPSTETQKHIFQLPKEDLQQFNRSWPHVDLESVVEGVYNEKKTPAQFYDELFWHVMNTRPRLAEEFKSVGFDPEKLHSETDRTAVQTLLSTCQRFQRDLISKSFGFASLPPRAVPLLRTIEKYLPSADVKKIIQEIRNEGFKSSTEFYDKLFWKLLGHNGVLAKKFSAVHGDIAKIDSPEDRKILESLLEFCRVVQIQSLAEDFGTDSSGISEELRRCAERIERAFPQVSTSSVIRKLRDGSTSSLRAYDELFWAVLNTRPELAKKFVEAKFDIAKIADAREREALSSLVTYSEFSQIQFFANLIGVNPSHIPVSLQPVLRSIEEMAKKRGKHIPYAEIKEASTIFEPIEFCRDWLYKPVAHALDINPASAEFMNLPVQFRNHWEQFSTFCTQTLPVSMQIKWQFQNATAVKPISREAPRVLKTDLRLVEKAKTATAIPNQNNLSRPITCGEYSVFVPLQGGGVMTVVDKAGQIIVLPKSVGQMQLAVDWNEVQKQFGTEKLSIRPIRGSHTLTSQLSPVLKTVADTLISQYPINGVAEWNKIPSRDIPFTPNSIRSVEDGKYIVCMDSRSNGTNNHLVFVTKDDHGKPITPRNWRRMQSIDTDSPQWPPSVVNALASMQRESIMPGFMILPDGPNVHVTADKISAWNDPGKKFIDNISDVVANSIKIDPARPAHLYYCSKNASEVMLVDMSNPDATTWHPQNIKLPKTYQRITTLQFDPSGRFLLLTCDSGLVILEKESMQEIKVISSVNNVHFDQSGRMRILDSESKLVVYDTNFYDLIKEIDDNRAISLRDKLKPIAFTDEVERERARQIELKKKYARYVPLKDEFEPKFLDRLAAAKSLTDVQRVGGQLSEFENNLRSGGIEPEGVVYITEAMRLALSARQKEMASREVVGVLSSVRSQLGQGNITISSILGIKGEFAATETVKAFVDDAQRREIRAVRRVIDEKIATLFMAESKTIAAKVDGIMSKVKSDLAGFKTMADFDDWQEFVYPDIVKELRDMREECPEEAREAYEKLIEARRTLDELAKKYEERFRREYTKIREKGAQQLRETIQTIETNIKMFLERMREKSFASRDDAEQYISVSKMKKSIEDEIKGLETLDAEASAKIARDFETGVIRFLSDVERGTLTKVDTGGHKVVTLGETEFPIWVEVAPEKLKRKVKLVFLPDKDANARLSKTSDWRGDIGVEITTSHGAVTTRRLYEGMGDEQEYRLGLKSYAGKSIPPAYVSASDFAKIKALFDDWRLGKKSKLRQEYKTKKAAVLALRAQKPDASDQAAYDAWKKSYDTAREEFGKFCADNYIYLFFRRDAVRREPEDEFENGKGNLIEWESYWTLDPHTEKYLERMAFELKQQIKLKAGLVMLRGHAGTGKDVLVDMLCALSKRRKFVFDCSKWTTEADLGEELTLQSAPGSMLPSTVRLPSAIVLGLQTPGAIIYFNEWNQMPPPSQLVLNALLDGKRSLALKTRSGTIIKAHPTVLLVASRNPSTYKGVNEMGDSTVSRTVEIDIEYPPLYRSPNQGDANKNKALDVSEALRIARSVDAFSRMAEESNMAKNQFVQMWDLYINGIDNGSPRPTEEQKFDLDVILALTQFGAQLRQHFMDRSGKNPDKKMAALPVNYPVTLREMRLCANYLSQMSLSKKLQSNPEQIARDLIDRYFLSHIEHVDDRNAVKSAMQNWTSAKRPAR